MPEMPWPDLRALRMTVLPVSGFQPGNSLVLRNGESLPELAEAFGFKPYRGRYVLRRGLTDPDFQASAFAVGGSVAFVLPEIPFRRIDPHELAYAYVSGGAGMPEAADRVDAALSGSQREATPVAAQVDAAATRRFRTLPLTPPGAMLADAVAFAKPDPFAVAGLTGAPKGAFAFLLTQKHAAIGSHDQTSAEIRVVAVDGSSEMSVWFTKSVTGGAASFSVSTPDETRAYPSRALATRHVSEAIMRAVGMAPGDAGRRNASVSATG